MEITRLDYYAALDLPPSANQRQIENAYQFALRNYAPDSLAAYGLVDDHDREIIVRFLNEARRTLGDAAAREAYNRKLIAEGRYAPERFAVAPDDAAPAEPPAPSAAIEAAPAEPPKAAEPAPEPARERRFWPFTNTEKPAPKPAPAPPPPPEPPSSLPALDGRPIGPDELRQIREHRGLRLDEVSEKTKISLTNLRCLEEGKYAFLPASVYVKGFLKTYARLLRIDGEKLVRDYMPNYEAHRPNS